MREVATGVWHWRAPHPEWPIAASGAEDVAKRLRSLLDLPAAIVLPTHTGPANRAALELPLGGGHPVAHHLTRSRMLVSDPDQAAPHVIDAEPLGVIARDHLLDHVDATTALTSWTISPRGRKSALATGASASATGSSWRP
ncbi:MAG: hypothetical protein NZL88_10455 [Gaiellaceae bacterium]|nr:hypothetical protein [Gaiellaceae bacterium]